MGALSNTALVNFLRTYDIEAVCSSIEPHSSEWLGGELSRILADHASSDRVVVPALKTIDILFSRGTFSVSLPPGDKAAGEILSSIERELWSCKDVAKLLAGVTVMSHFATLQGPSRKQSVSQLLNLLFHRYPTVRKFCAEQIYLLLLQIGEELIGRESSDEALEVIGETCWDGQLECITVHRDQLFKLFHMDSTPRQRSLAPREKGSANKTTLIDENDSYGALVDAAGY